MLLEELGHSASEAEGICFLQESNMFLLVHYPEQLA